MDLSEHVMFTSVYKWSSHLGVWGCLGPPGQVLSVSGFKCPGLLRKTILPRVIDTTRQADNRGARWLPITNTSTDTDTGPSPAEGGRHRGTGEDWAWGGEVQGAGAQWPCSPEKGQTRGLFWFLKHMDCFVLSLKYCSLTDMALTIENGQRGQMSLSEIKA